MKGYKAFNSDWTCRGFQYKVGETYEMDGELIICKNGFHFCQELKDCFYFYPFNKDVKIAEVEALGDIKDDDFSSKCCTNKIKIIREIRFEDLMPVVEPRCGVFSSNTFYEPGILDLGIERAACINFEIVLDGTLQVLSRELNVKKGGFFAPYIYTYLANYNAITDIKEKSHEF